MGSGMRLWRRRGSEEVLKTWQVDLMGTFFDSTIFFFFLAVWDCDSGLGEEAFCIFFISFFFFFRSMDYLQ